MKVTLWKRKKQREFIVGAAIAMVEYIKEHSMNTTNLLQYCEFIFHSNDKPYRVTFTKMPIDTKPQEYAATIWIDTPPMGWQPIRVKPFYNDHVTSDHARSYLESYLSGKA